MKFLVDEDVYGDLVEALAAKHIDLISVKRVCEGATDGEVVKLAQRQERTIITGDKGYGDRVFRQGQIVPVILLRLADLRPSEAVARALSVIDSRDDWHIFFTVITSANVRMKPLPVH